MPKTHYCLALKSDNKPLKNHESNYRSKCVYWGLLSEKNHLAAANVDESNVAEYEAKLKNHVVIEIDVPDTVDNRPHLLHDDSGEKKSTSRRS